MLVVHPTSTCDVCMDGYNWTTPENTPWAISCGHIFCLSCLQSLRPCLCPLCRKPFVFDRIKKLHVSQLNDERENGNSQTAAHNEAIRFLERIALVSGVDAPEDDVNEVMSDVQLWLVTQPPYSHNPLRYAVTALERGKNLQKQIAEDKNAIHRLSSKIQRYRHAANHDRETSQAIEASLTTRLQEVETELTTKVQTLQAELDRFRHPLNPLPRPPKPSLYNLPDRHSPTRISTDPARAYTLRTIPQTQTQGQPNAYPYHSTRPALKQIVIPPKPNISKTSMFGEPVQSLSGGATTAMIIPPDAKIFPDLPHMPSSEPLPYQTHEPTPFAMPSHDRRTPTQSQMYVPSSGPAHAYIPTSISTGELGYSQHYYRPDQGFNASAPGASTSTAPYLYAPTPVHDRVIPPQLARHSSETGFATAGETLQVPSAQQSGGHRRSSSSSDARSVSSHHTTSSLSSIGLLALPRPGPGAPGHLAAPPTPQSASSWGTLPSSQNPSPHLTLSQVLSQPPPPPVPGLGLSLGQGKSISPTPRMRYEFERSDAGPSMTATERQRERDRDHERSSTSHSHSRPRPRHATTSSGPSGQFDQSFRIPQAPRRISPPERSASTPHLYAPPRHPNGYAPVSVMTSQAHASGSNTLGLDRF